MELWCHFSNLRTDLRTGFSVVSIFDFLNFSYSLVSITPYTERDLFDFFSNLYSEIANSNVEPNSCIVQRQLNTPSTYPVPNVPAPIWHGGAAVAPSSAPAARSAPRTTSVRTGTRAGVVPAGTATGTGPSSKSVCWFWFYFNDCSYSQANKGSSYLDFDLDCERDREREWWEPSLERAGERLEVLTEPRGDALLEAGCEVWTNP